jgi:hypothetical protein
MKTTIMAFSAEEMIDLTSDSDDELQCIGRGKLGSDRSIYFRIPLPSDLCFLA